MLLLLPTQLSHRLLTFVRWTWGTGAACRWRAFTACLSRNQAHCTHSPHSFMGHLHRYVGYEFCPGPGSHRYWSSPVLLLRPLPGRLGRASRGLLFLRVFAIAP